jgi:hypothetical protein
VKKSLLVVLGLVMILAISIGLSTSIASASPPFPPFPKVTPVPPPVPQAIGDKGAYIRIDGIWNGDVKVKYGWLRGTPASAAAGYWFGIYDVENSHYVGAFDTGALGYPVKELSNEFTTHLPKGSYKLVLFVRAGGYPDAPTNIVALDGLAFNIP